MSVRLASILAGGSTEPWVALGFDLDRNGTIAFANGSIEFVGGDAGLVGLSLDVDDAALDLPADVEGIPLRRGAVAPAGEHRNGATELDHLVVRTPDLDASSAAFDAATGLGRRRIRETGAVRQAFHRFAGHGAANGCILELVEDTGTAAPWLWGLVINVADLDAVVERLGPDLIGAAKDAVQPSRRIATMRSGAGLGVPVALMDHA